MRYKSVLHQSATVLFIFATVMATVIGCSKKEMNTPELQEDLIAVKLKLQGRSGAPANRAMVRIKESLASHSLYFKHISSFLDASTARLYQNEAENKFSLLYRFSNDTTKLYSVYGILSERAVQIEGEVLLATESYSDGSYAKYVVKNQEAFQVLVDRKGNRSFQDVQVRPLEKWRITLTADCQGRHGGTGFCQREPNESFGACHRAEVDEFTDDFAGWLFYKMNELVVDAMIAAACACSATQCPK